MPLLLVFFDAYWWTNAAPSIPGKPKDSKAATKVVGEAKPADELMAMLNKPVQGG